MSHTPGPYFVDESGRYVLASPPPKTSATIAIADVGCGAVANARLIAAAPELLEACRKAKTCASISPAVMDLISAAIAKATVGCLLLFCLSAKAEDSLSASLVSAPVAIQAKQHNFNRWDAAICTGVVAYHVGDYFSTEHSQAHGGYEVELPQAFVSSKAGFASYSLGLAGLEIAGSVYLHKHGHAKLARFADSLSVAGGTATDLNNIGAVNHSVKGVK